MMLNNTTQIAQNTNPPYITQGSQSQKPAEAQPKAEIQNPVMQKFLAGRGVKGFYMPIEKTAAVQEAKTNSTPWKNDLRSKFQNNDVKIMAIILRSFNAKDGNNDELLSPGEEKGTFINAVQRLDKVKALGINTFHLLPIQPPGEQESLGNAGSVYAPKDFLSIDPELVDKNDPRSPQEQFKYFVDECHKRDIRVMIDLPSCVSLDFYNQPENKKYMAVSDNGAAKVPQGWNDIRMFETFQDEDTRNLNKNLVQLHKDFIDMCVDLGVDGIRADVARAKPPEFWDEVITYSRQKDPQFAWLAETYTYEDASPMLNMPYDRPEEILNAGFATYYGQYHIFHQWLKADDLHDYMRENLDMTHRLDKGKSLIGSFATHDDISPMYQGKELFCNLASGLMLTLPMTNPYIVDGYQSGDYYKYKYGNKLMQPAQEAEKSSEIKKFDVHEGMIDIFNTSRRPGGKSPEIGNFFAETSKMRDNYKDVITKGSYIPLEVKGNKSSENIIAYARHNKGKTLLVIANRNMNDRRTGVVEIPGLKAYQKMQNLVPSYGEQSKFQPKDNSLNVDLGPGRFHVFEINTPHIEDQADEVLVQNL
jgi:glycosidase